MDDPRPKFSYGGDVEPDPTVTCVIGHSKSSATKAVIEACKLALKGAKRGKRR